MYKIIRLFKILNKSSKLNVIIDIVFYVFILTGFMSIAYIARFFDIKPYYASMIWIGLFIPIVILKFKKDINIKKGD